MLVPIRGLGKCLTADHANRLEEQECNTQECVGDEIWMAMQDLVIAVDSSGSLRESGFETVKKFLSSATRASPPAPAKRRRKTLRSA